MGLIKSAKRGLNLTGNVIDGSIPFAKKSILNVALYLFLGAVASLGALVLGGILALVAYWGSETLPALKDGASHSFT